MFKKDIKKNIPFYSLLQKLAKCLLGIVFQESWFPLWPAALLFCGANIWRFFSLQLFVFLVRAAFFFHICFCLFLKCLLHFCDCNTFLLQHFSAVFALSIHVFLFLHHSCFHSVWPFLFCSVFSPCQSQKILACLALAYEEHLQKFGRKKKENKKQIRCIYINGLKDKNYTDFNETHL